MILNCTQYVICPLWFCYENVSFSVFYLCASRNVELPVRGIFYTGNDWVNSLHKTL